MALPEGIRTSSSTRTPGASPSWRPTARLPCPSKLHLKYTDKIKEMYRRHAETRLLEDEQALDHGLEIGCGGFWLRLNEEQYKVLRGRKAKVGTKE
jgi:hypothetical protein